MRVLSPVLIAALILPSYQTAQACECKPPGGVAQEYPRANLIFSGEVAELNAREVSLRVCKMWKGAFAERITLRVDSPCSFRFKLGERYLVYTAGTGRAKAHLCSGTRRLEGAEDIRELERFGGGGRSAPSGRSAPPAAESDSVVRPTANQRFPYRKSVDAQDEKVAEQKLWDSIGNGSDPEEYKTFLRKYPRGRFEAEARSRLSGLLGEDYVTLFTKQVNVNRRWADVERTLGRRAALIPKLYEILRAAGVQERELYGQIAETRSRLLNAMNAMPPGGGEAKTPEQKQSVIDADNGFGKSLWQLNSALENYPQMRSNENFLKVQDELAGVENRIAVARSDYNSAVQDYHTARKEPRMAGVAGRHGFTEEPYFKSDQGQPVAPKVPPVSPASTRLPGRARMRQRVISRA